MKPSRAMATRRSANPSISPARNPISKPPTADSTPTGSAGSGLCRSRPRRMTATFRSSPASSSPAPRPVTCAGSVPVMAAQIADAELVLPMPMSPPATRCAPRLARSSATSAPFEIDRRACSRLIAGSRAKFAVPLPARIVSSPVPPSLPRASLSRPAAPSLFP